MINISFRQRKFFSYCFFKKFSSVNVLLTKHKEKIESFVDKKIVLYNVLDLKIYHFSILGNETKELFELQNINSYHFDLISQIARLRDPNFKNINIKKRNIPFCLLSKIQLINTTTLPLSYFDFLHFIKFYNEVIEEFVNDIIRDLIEDNADTQIITNYFKKFRDDWRTCFSPDILNEKLSPIYEPNTLSNIVIKVNEQLTKIL